MLIENDFFKSHDLAWSIAEQNATDYGQGKAGNLTATQHESRWFQFTQLFRFIMRNRSLTIGSLIVLVYFVLTLLAYHINPIFQIASSPCLPILSSPWQQSHSLTGSPMLLTSRVQSARPMLFG